eukprot:TRINITY_DN10856_c0_g1_i1.p2 TRINITY_DN10856_c0_g1~~TRINITY_DN10856_c0_g1_i1.p2  ORF type:complete len:311 (+),score=85.21 TRINITY_DN10856_c0_g1_i1:1016-1948(+)
MNAMKNVDANDIILKAIRFSGGLFFGLGFVHLLPESSLVISAYFNTEKQIAFLVAPVGFFLIWMIEKVILNKEPEKDVMEMETFKKDKLSYISLNENKDLEDSLMGSQDQLLVNDKEKDTKKEKDTEKEKHNEKKEHGHGHGHGHSHGVVVDTSSNANIIGSLFLMFMISLHSIIEGITLGIQTSVVKLTPILIAIMSHKWGDSLAFGVNLTKMETTFKKYIIVILLTSLTTPVGVVIGALVSISIPESVSAVVSAFILAFAAGSFLYISLFDILLTEFSNPSQKWAKFFFLILGITFISFLTFWIDEDA